MRSPPEGVAGLVGVKIVPRDVNSVHAGVFAHAIPRPTREGHPLPLPYCVEPKPSVISNNLSKAHVRFSRLHSVIDGRLSNTEGFHRRFPHRSLPTYGRGNNS